MSEFLIYFLTFIILFAIVFALFKLIEYLVCVYIKDQPPMVASLKIMRKILVQELKKHYKDVKVICEIGCGFGGMTHYIARKTKANVIGLENMPMSVFIAKMFSFNKRVKIIYCDAFEYLEKTDKKIDVAVAYLSPRTNPKLLKYSDKIKVLMSFDFPVLGIKPVRTINIGHGYTRINRKKFPHKLFVYEMSQHTKKS